MGFTWLWAARYKLLSVLVMLWISPKDDMDGSVTGVLIVDSTVAGMVLLRLEFELLLVDAGVSAVLPTPAKKERPPRALDAYVIILHLS